MEKTLLDQVATHPLQTKAWAEFRKKWGNEILYTKYGLITLHKLPLTNYKIGMFIKGPKPTQAMLNELKKLAQEKALIFIKLEPNFAKATLGAAQFNKTLELLKKNGCVPGKTLFTPTTFWIDLTKPEDELLKSFSSKTRYNIRLAQKKGVEVIEDNSPEAFKTYLKLMAQTVKRQSFYAHNKRYHQLMWEVLRRAGIAHLLVAKYHNKIITTWIIFVWKKFLYYPYGASSTEHKNLMANNLMMWETIRFGKNQILKTFDLWGREPGKGFTRFKEGYNPEVVEFLGTWDLVINQPFYWFYRLSESLRWPFLRAKSRLSKPRF
jgi:lipid II:glycine glycyltransferase (peptidoglycan interpeptide bridge formation enzyme)